MLHGKKVAVVLPAYNAAKTLERTVADIPRDVVDDIILTDDASSDATVTLARTLGLHTLVHAKNRGYGGNQKTCYAAALDRGADIVVMLHPDYQYAPKLITAMASMLASGEYDVVMASRILGTGALAGGMPVYKYVANRVLTLGQNLLLGAKMSEYHSGYRAFTRETLLRLPIQNCSDDFVFDNQMISQAIFSGCKVGEISCPTRYFAEASSINLRRSIVYGFGVLATAISFRLQRWKVLQSPIFADCVRTPGSCASSRQAGRALLPSFLVAVCLGLPCLGVLISVTEGSRSADLLQRSIQGLSSAGPLVLTLMLLAQIAVAASGIVPASMIGIVAGLLWGVLPGFFVAAFSMFAGAMLTFVLARRWSNPSLQRLFSRRPRLQRIESSLAREGWRFVCLLRLSPVMPFAATSYLLGASSVAVRDYVIGTCASLPALLGYVVAGALCGHLDAIWASRVDYLSLASFSLAIVATLLSTLKLGRLTYRVLQSGGLAEVG